jgi:hypothetical protein
VKRPLRFPSPALRATSPASGRGETLQPPLPLAGEGWGEGNRFTDSANCAASILELVPFGILPHPKPPEGGFDLTRPAGDLSRKRER